MRVPGHEGDGTILIPFSKAQVVGGLVGAILAGYFLVASSPFPLGGASARELATTVFGAAITIGCLWLALDASTYILGPKGITRKYALLGISRQYELDGDTVVDTPPGN